MEQTEKQDLWRASADREREGGGSILISIELGVSRGQEKLNKYWLKSHCDRQTGSGAGSRK